MNRTSTSRMVGMLLVGLTMGGRAEPQELVVLVEHFEVREEEATRLSLDGEDAVEMRAAMDRLGAEAVDVAYLLARHGERCRARSVVVSSDPAFAYGRPILLGMFTPREALRRERRIFVFATTIPRGQVERPGARAAGGNPADPFSDPEEARHDEDFGVTIGIELIEVAQPQLAERLKGVPRRAGAQAHPRAPGGRWQPQDTRCPDCF